MVDVSSVPGIVIGGLIVSVFSALGGYFLRVIKAPNLFLPRRGKTGEREYEFIFKDWHQYHYTYDPKVNGGKYLAHMEMTLEKESGLIAYGNGKFVLRHRRPLKYRVRGEASHGKFYYTAVCEQEPRDTLTAIYSNLLDDKMVGLLLGMDYVRNQYVSPVVLSDSELTEDEVKELISSEKLEVYGPIPSNNE